jgi:hypothetical protein
MGPSDRRVRVGNHRTKGQVMRKGRDGGVLDRRGIIGQMERGERGGMS